jgi:hypothetical protein
VEWLSLEEDTYEALDDDEIYSLWGARGESQEK